MRWTISRRLAVGFGLCVTLIAGLGGVSVYEMRKQSQSLRDVVEMSRDTESGMSLGNDLLSCRVAVKEFVISGEQTWADRFKEYSSKMSKTIDECQAAFQNPERKRWIAELDERFGRYTAAFDQVVRLSGVRASILSDKMNPNGAATSQELDAAAAAAVAAGNVKAAETIYNALADVATARLEAVRYSLSPSDKHRDGARSAVESATEVIRDASAALSGTPFAAAVDRAGQALGNYASALTEMIATTE